MLFKIKINTSIIAKGGNHRIVVRAAEPDAIMADPAFGKFVTFGHDAVIAAFISHVDQIAVAALAGIKPFLLALMT